METNKDKSSWEARKKIICELVDDSIYVPMKEKEMAAFMQVAKEDREEFREILRELLTHKGQVLTRQSLLNRLWKYDFYGDERVVDTHIKNLRKKLGIDFIRTIRGVGYKIE